MNRQTLPSSIPHTYPVLPHIYSLLNAPHTLFNRTLAYVDVQPDIVLSLITFNIASEASRMTPAKARKGLLTFKHLGLPDLRNLDAEVRRSPQNEIAAGATTGEAIVLLELHMGFIEKTHSAVIKSTPIGSMRIVRHNLPHLIEKREDARERYVRIALDTLENPYEIWETPYDDDMVRYIFIGTYKQKQQMLVVVAPWDGKVLWNFMHTEVKSLNKHRQGNLLYSR